MAKMNWERAAQTDKMRGLPMDAETRLWRDFRRGLLTRQEFSKAMYDLNDPAPTSRKKRRRRLNG